VKAKEGVKKRAMRKYGLTQEGAEDLAVWRVQACLGHSASSKCS
jgi:hypothetical protein